MIHRCFIFLWIFCLLAVARAEVAPSFEYGPRPNVPLFDPTGFLTPDQAAKIVEPLETIRKKNGVDVFVVVLPDIGDTPPAYVAGQFAQAWGNPQLHAIVLYCPGRKDGPWIIPGGTVLSLIKPGVIEKAVKDAQRRASREPYESGKIRAAATESADLLRIWSGGAITQGETIMSWRDSVLAARQDRLLLFKYIGLGLGCALIPLTLAAWKISRHLQQRHPCKFPDPTYARRLGAPFCGGNSAALDLEATSRRS